jgi:cytoskeletal protein RodZ
VNPKTSDPTPDERALRDGAESSLGVLLRRAREAQGLSLRDISDQTRISRRYLEAIEADDYKNLPGGIFNRSFVKAFAKTVGVNEAEAIRGYERTARAHGETPDELPTSRQPSRIYTEGESVRSPLVTILLSVIILAVISLGVYAALHWYQRRNEARTQAPPAAPPPAANPTAQAPAPAPTQTAPPAPAQGLKVQVRAKGTEVWLRSKTDGAPSTDGVIAADQVKELLATDTLSLQYSKSKVNAIEVTINGRPAVVPTEAPKGKQLVELLITKDNYASLLQQP